MAEALFRLRDHYLKLLLACAGCFLLPTAATGNPATAAEATATAAVDANSAPAPSSTGSEIRQLRQLLAGQQLQIDELRRALARQNNVTAGASPQENRAPAPPILHPSTGEVAGTRQAVPGGPVAPSASSPWPSAAPAPVPQKDADENGSPLQLKVGNTYITPIGFLDLTEVTRSTNTGNALATNFGSIPFSTTAKGALSESRLTVQNSRIGLRADALVHGMEVLGYLEADFVGFTPANVSVSSNSDSLRLRQYFVQISRGKFEFLGGQAWGMLTPNRRGISPLPSEVFNTQDVDVNYQAGLVFTRQAGFRVLYHPNHKVVFGVALENPEQYMGGSGGGGLTVLPAAYSGLQSTQLADGNSSYAVPNAHPDIIAKVAFDPTPKFHLEIAGLESTFRIAKPTTLQTFTKAGGGASINLGFEVARGLRMLTNNFWSDGGGRYIFGLAPDVVVRADGSISPVHAGSTVSGFEYTHKKTMFYALYGGVYIQRDTAIDTTGKLVGYGYSGSGNGQNRAIQEGTAGINRTLWKDARWGALNLMFQYSYLQRNPWYVASGQPPDANLHMGFVDLRYTLPGAAPYIEK